MTTTELKVLPYTSYEMKNGMTVRYSQPYFMYSIVCLDDLLYKSVKDEFGVYQTLHEVPCELNETDIANLVQREINPYNNHMESPLRRRTLAFVIGKDNSIVMSASVACPKDNFSKKIGREICAGRIKKFIYNNFPEVETLEEGHTCYFSDVKELAEMEGELDPILFAPINAEYITAVVEKHIKRRDS